MSTSWVTLEPVEKRVNLKLYFIKVNKEFILPKCGIEIFLMIDLRIAEDVDSLSHNCHLST